MEVEMERQKVTLSVPKDVLSRVERLAAERGTSVSALLTEKLEELVRPDDGYARARERHLRRLDQPTDLGTGGHLRVARDELHERA
jgi:hypothetical protein